ncbi:MAG: tetratricopeptide repeat protein, partial [Bacteroidetes bacterium]|nr:tetratricopeptide repeat protein [Bacteroidota bacterium]
ILSLIFLTSNLFAQQNRDQLLADQYFEQEEYEKAAPLYKKLLDKTPGSEIIYKKYLNTLLLLSDYEKAEKMVRKQIKRFKKQLPYRVDLGYVYAEAGNPDKAKEQYNSTIQSLNQHEGDVKVLATTFAFLGEYDYAIETYLRGQKILKNENLFNFELGQLYAHKGDIPMMVATYLDVIEFDGAQLQLIRNTLQDALVKDVNYRFLQEELYKRIQKSPDNVDFLELLVWSLVQQREFEKALIHVKSIDKRKKEKGTRVLKFARFLVEEGSFKAAIIAFEYVVSSGERYLVRTARMELLSTRKESIVNSFGYTNEDLLRLEKDYERLIEEYGKNNNTATLLQELAQLEALYLNNSDRAIMILTDLIGFPGLDKTFKARCKLDLGDVYLFKNEPWEAMLIFSQVDKAFKDDPTGDEARYRNARLSYYTGEFEWSQTQLDILKASTSKLIANDALHLSVFITENLGLDTIKTPLHMYAQSDLLIFQHRIDEAIDKLDSIILLFPGHTLADDIAFKKAKIHISRNNYDEAIRLLKLIITDFTFDINADDALFLLADIYHHALDDPEQALQMYQKLMINYSDSTYTVEARKQFRLLRGDKFN